MTYEEKRQKEREKKIKKFHKELGVLGRSEQEINHAVVEFAKTCKFGWGEIFLTEAQEKDFKFMLSIFGANESLLNQYYIPRELKSDERFVIEYLKLYFAREQKEYRAFKYYNVLKDFPIRENIDFLTLFARTFPECNIMEIVEKIADEHFINVERKEMFEQFGAILAKDICISQARRHGYRFVRYISSKNPYFMETLMTGIEKDGFKSLACLPIEKIWENRDLIAFASKHDNFEGLRRYFLNTLSPRQERDYMCHGDLHTYTHMEYEFYPLRKALIEDEALIGQIEGDKDEIEELFNYISKDTKAFYASVRPYEERGLVVPKGNGNGQTVGSALTQFLFGENATPEDGAKTKTVTERIAENVQRGKDNK